ncbi:hypothetical protein BC940DRAFT_138252 [Gongronella butleri]|nr:hypothetical protein BC940DRAFT_138252 [Gongronella butleri]
MRLNKRCHLTRGDRAKVKKLLQRGMLPREVAAQCDISVDTVRRVQLEPENYMPSRAPLDTETEKRIVQMLQNGDTANKISLELGVSDKRIWAVRKRYKIPVPQAYARIPIPDEKKQAIRRLLEANHTNTYAAKEHNVTLRAVAKIRKEFNIPGLPCHRRLDESTREEIIKLLLDGAQSSTVLKQFGICAATLHEIRKQNNIPVTGPGRPISDALGKKITRLLEQGLTDNAIAAITGVVKMTVARRRRWRFGERPSPFYPPEKIETIKKLLADGLYPRKVAEKVGINCSNIYRLINRHNLKVNYEVPKKAKIYGARFNPHMKKIAAHATMRATNAQDTQNSCNGITFLDEIPFVVMI